MDKVNALQDHVKVADAMRVIVDVLKSQRREDQGDQLVVCFPGKLFVSEKNFKCFSEGNENKVLVVF